MQDHIRSPQRLDTTACIETYSSQFVSDHRNVLLVTDISNATNSFLDGYTHQPDNFDTFWWMCGSSYYYSSAICTTSVALKYASDWKVGQYDLPVQYCLAEPFPDHCKLEVSIGILVVVAVCNLAKVLCTLAAFRLVRPSPLITVGDAIASFLTNADQTTTQNCLLSKRDVQRGKWKQDPAPTQWHGSEENTVRRAAGRRTRFFSTLVL